MEDVKQEENIFLPKQQNEKEKKKFSSWLKLSIVSLVCGCFTLIKGIDKLVRYDAGEYYPYEPVNAYVGGDAYNFIINGTYATSYFVLTTMFVLAAIGLVMVHYLAQRNDSNF